jgi:hypothetical protein
MGQLFLLMLSICLLWIGCYRLIFNIKKIDFLDLYIFFIALFFGLYTVIDIFSKDLVGLEIHSIFSSIGSAILIVCILIWMCYIFGLRNNSKFLIYPYIQDLEALKPKYLIFPFIILIAKIYFATIIDFSDVIEKGMVAAPRPSLPYYYVVLDQFAKICAFFTAISSLVLLKKTEDLTKNFLLKIILFVALYMLFSSGRRVLFSFIFFAFYYFIVSGENVLNNRFRLAVVFVLASVSFAILGNIFQTYRSLTYAGVRIDAMANSYLADINSVNLADFIDFSKTANNLSERTAIWQFNYYIHDGCLSGGRCAFSYGELLTKTAYGWIPAAFYSDSTSKLLNDSDVDISLQFSLPVVDWPTNLFALLFADFGYLSLIFGPAYMFLILYCLTSITHLRSSAFMRSITFSMIWFFVCQIESDYMDWIGVIRNILILHFIYALFEISSCVIFYPSAYYRRNK